MGEEEKRTERDPFLLDESPCENEQFFDLYPARRGSSYKFGYKDMALGYADKQENIDVNASRVIKWLDHPNYTLVKVLLSALRSHGCVTDVFERHLAIETCKPGGNVEHLGGYDEKFNQIFICGNNMHSAGRVHGFLVRQLIEMFDACVNKMDHRDTRHLACTEIRKWNLAYCNVGENFNRPNGSFSCKDMHKTCVRDQAILSMHHLRFVPMDLAVKAVDAVFNKCYNDLEPIGRRCWNRDSFKLVDREKKLLGYD